MNRTIGFLTIAMLLPASGAIFAHHSVAMFDTGTPVTVMGQVVRFELSNPHSFLYVEQDTPEGPIVIRPRPAAVRPPDGDRNVSR
jgi:hypothetical protein